MARIIPFNGLLYNPEKIQDIKEVVAPPYDVISKSEQKMLHERHSNNIIRLIFGETTENDTDSDNPHTRAAGYFNQWISEDILSRDESPALYLTSVEFTAGEKTITRYGLIALVGVEPFEKGIVLPHEKTFSKVKSERLELMKVAHANFCPIFSLYPDRENVLETLKEATLNMKPDIDIPDDKGQQHKLWRITDASVHRYITDTMKGKKIFIADGHHRYETAMNYRNWLSKKNPEFDADHPANYVMMYLSSMEDPGLVIRPAHRILNDIDDSQRDGFIEKAKAYFDIETIPFNGKEPDNALETLRSTLKLNAENNTLGVYIKNCNECYVLTLTSGVMKAEFGDEVPKSLRQLDVTVLTRLIFMEILGFDQARLDNEKLISYSSIEEQAVEEVTSGRSDMAFILNPTKIEQVRKIAEEGLTMPRKATYFYPKAISGQVLNKLSS